ncbi:MULTISPECIES: hypothetical protein [unclassified Kitasatospora]|uniref:hypothetical protein n=1 Tax=unclassified Kitasatospora TaxID=2633591 RepID=UPI0033FF6D41
MVNPFAKEMSKIRHRIGRVVGAGANALATTPAFRSGKPPSGRGGSEALRSSRFSIHDGRIAILARWILSFYPDLAAAGSLGAVLERTAG